MTSPATEVDEIAPAAVDTATTDFERSGVVEDDRRSGGEDIIVRHPDIESKSSINSTRLAAAFAR